MKINDKRTFRLVLILVNLLLVGCFAFVSLEKRDYSANQKRNSYLIGMSYMTMNNEFYKIMSEEINARIESEGDRRVLRDPALDADRQAEQIQEMLDMRIDLLIVTPADPEKLIPVLETAKKQGVKIVMLDTNVNREGLADCVITSDNYEAGVLVGQYFLQQCEKAKVLVMTHEAAKSGQDRVAGFLNTVSGHSGIEIVGKIECEGQLEIAMPKIQEAIDRGTEFDQVFCLNDLSSIGVIAALEENYLLDDVGVYGVDASPDAKALIKEGMLKASAAQFPSEIGKKAADAIYRVLEEKPVESPVLVPTKLVTRENVEQFGTDRWQ